MKYKNYKNKKINLMKIILLVYFIKKKNSLMDMSKDYKKKIMILNNFRLIKQENLILKIKSFNKKLINQKKHLEKQNKNNHF